MLEGNLSLTTYYLVLDHELHILLLLIVVSKASLINRFAQYKAEGEIIIIKKIINTNKSCLQTVKETQEYKKV